MGNSYYSRANRHNLPGRTNLSVAERLAWARAQWTKDPSIPVNGRHGMHQRMLDVFRVSAKVEQLHELKEEVMQELKRNGAPSGPGKPMNPVLTPEKLAASMAKPHAIVVSKPSSSAPSADAPPPTAEPEPAAAPIYQRLGCGKTIDDARERRRFARAIVREGMSVEDVRLAVQDEFGIGIDTAAAAQALEEAGLLSSRRQRADERTSRRAPIAPAPPPGRPPVAPPTADAADQIRAAIELLFAEVPGLVLLEVRRGADGRPTVSYKVETIQSGSMSL